MKSFLLILMALSGISCSFLSNYQSMNNKPNEDECLQYFVLKELPTHLESSPYYIPVLAWVKNGDLQIKITATNDNPLPENILSAIRNGRSLREIQKSERAVDVLIKTEESIKKIPRIKSVTWTVAEPCPRGIHCSTTTGFPDTSLETRCNEFKQ